MINSHFTAAFNDLQDRPVDVLREDPTLVGFMRAHDLAVVVYDACEACRYDEVTEHRVRAAGRPAEDN